MASWNELCRCCLSPNAKVSLLDETTNLKEKFREITTIEVKQDDGLPLYLCCDCNTVMNSAYHFRQQCLQLDGELRQQLQTHMHVDAAEVTEAEDTEMVDKPMQWMTKNVKSEPLDSDDDNYYVLVIDDPKEKKGNSGKAQIEENNDKEVEDSEGKEQEPPLFVKTELIQNFHEATNDDNETEMSVIQQEEITSDSFETSSYYMSNTRVSANVPATILENEEEGQTMEELYVASMESVDNQNSNSEQILPDITVDNEQEMTEDNMEEIQIGAIEGESGEGDQENSNIIKILATTDADGTIVLKGTDGIQYYTKTQLVVGDDGKLHEEEVIYCDSENNSQLQILSCDDSELIIEYSGDTDQIATVYQQDDGSLLCECGQYFTDLEEYEKHQVQHKQYTYDHLCDLCGKGFETQEILKGHRLLHRLSTPVIKCPYCSLQMKRTNLTQHIKTAHGDVKPECGTCGKLFANTTNLKRHMSTHTGIKEFECDICYKRFHQKITMQVHRMKHVSPFACSKCDLLFESKLQLAKHNSMNICPGAKNVVQAKQDLIQTVKKTITTNLGKLLGYACSVCKKMFSLESALEQHVESVHMSNQAELTCPECSESFYTKKKLQSHMNAHKTSKNMKRFECLQCGKPCASQAMLIMHERVHTNERPYGCELCTLRFKTKTHLRTHQLTHTREKKFGCSVCMKFFALKGNLVVHLRTHTGERPYSCSICTESFIDSKYLKKHKLKRHNIDSNVHWNEYYNKL